MTGTADGYWFNISDPNRKGDCTLEVFHEDRKIAETPCAGSRVGEAFDLIADTHRRFGRVS